MELTRIAMSCCVRHPAGTLLDLDVRSLVLIKRRVLSAEVAGEEGVGRKGGREGHLNGTHGGGRRGIHVVF